MTDLPSFDSFLSMPHSSVVQDMEADPPWQLGDGMDVWTSIATGAPSPRKEVIIEAHPLCHLSCHLSCHPLRQVIIETHSLCHLS